MGLLGEIFSAGDGAKRKLKGLLSDPLGELGLLGTRMAEDIQNQLDVYSKAYPLDPRLNPRLDTAQGREMVVDQNVARNKLAEMAANMGMAATFIGPTARTWDALAAKRAQDLYAKKVDPRIIWKETGTFRGPDGMWRQEIDDSVSVPGQRLYSWGEAADLKAQNTVPVRRQKALLHPPLSAAYPDTKQIGVLLKPGSPNGAYVADTDWITVGAGKNGAADRSLMLHELQHAVQKREGFASGGSPSEFATGPMFDKRASDLASELSQNINGSVSAKPQEIIQTLKYGEPEELKAIANRHGFATVDDAVKFLANEDARRTPLGQYQRLAGEAEARATQSRMNMDAAKRREVFPLDSYDVPLNELIIRLGAKP